MCVTKSLCFSHETNTTLWINYACVCAQSLQSRPTLGDPMDWSPPGFSVCGILQAKILEWVAMLSSRGSCQPRNQTLWHLLHWHVGSLSSAPLGEPESSMLQYKIKKRDYQERVDNKARVELQEKTPGSEAPRAEQQKLLSPLAQEGADYRPRQKAQLRERTQRSKSEGHREKYPGTSKPESCREAARE